MAARLPLVPWLWLGWWASGTCDCGLAKTNKRLLLKVKVADICLAVVADEGALLRRDAVLMYGLILIHLYKADRLLSDLLALQAQCALRFNVAAPSFQARPESITLAVRDHLAQDPLSLTQESLKLRAPPELAYHTVGLVNDNLVFFATHPHDLQLSTESSPLARPPSPDGSHDSMFTTSRREATILAQAMPDTADELVQGQLSQALERTTVVRAILPQPNDQLYDDADDDDADFGFSPLDNSSEPGLPEDCDMRLPSRALSFCYCQQGSLSILLMLMLEFLALAAVMQSPLPGIGEPVMTDKIKVFLLQLHLPPLNSQPLFMSPPPPPSIPVPTPQYMEEWLQNIFKAFI
ncbi:uncharacterized protein MONBRDRAFT_26500 [Monosiga brevicollis MX1]|uniref:Rad21/Rec8-like protein N-terminal domain-containing protein n=1 Tax=Monosiga brevicollis TaxID=81824 RepID=A9V2J5_MONBE|nr:uncharacterized protein MONBRDRAFT_26500 [Monosiga brevicollis MX1]EDQ88268.1 predicted protein [Monosiga brevicollis MX1]|eukprot:XP_001746861.1 hypothetical protein [Monosiga brevicollis MX1]